MAKTGLTKPESLDAVPIKNQLCREEATGEGLVRLLVPVRETLMTKVMRRLTYVPKFKKIELDEVGTFVWQQCDGRTNVRALIDRVSKRYKLTQRESEVSVTLYLRTLARRNLIGLAVRPHGHGRRD